MFDVDSVQSMADEVERTTRAQDLYSLPDFLDGDDTAELLLQRRGKQAKTRGIKWVALHKRAWTALF